MDYVLSTSSLTKQYKKQRAVDNVSLHIAKGQIYGFIGRNGAGKTTFLKMVSGLADPTEGEISLFGQSGNKRRQVLSRIGTLIEEPGLYPGMTAYDNLKLKCMCVGIKKEGYIEDILRMIGLENAGKKKIRNYSLGMRQRLGIGIALVGEPDLLVLDEPINGLDPQGMAEVRDIILKLQKEKDMSILIASHILSELSKVATNYGIIHEGKLIKELSGDEIAQACGEHIEIRLSNPKAAIPVLDMMGLTEYRVTDNQTIRIFECLDQSGKINMELVKSNIQINSITVSGESIDDYFLNLTGGIHHA